MNLSELERSGEIERVDKDAKVASELIASAESDITTAHDVLKLKHYDWVLTIAYTAMLNAGRALMFAKGYRIKNESSHVTVVRFCASMLPATSSSLTTLFNRYRVRRNDIVYGESRDSVSESEAKNTIDNAKRFIEEVKKHL